MYEIFLLAIVIVLLVGLQLLAGRINNPLLLYLKASAAIALLLLVWLFGKDNNIAVRVILSVLVLTSVYKEYLASRKTQ